MNLQNITSKLRNFSENNLIFYPHRLYKDHYYSESVRDLIADKGAYWLVERIFSKRLKARTQFWNLKILPEACALLVCNDDEGRALYHEYFSLPAAAKPEDVFLILENGILKLRS